MRFFLFITLLTAFFMGITMELGMQKTPIPPKKTPAMLMPYQRKIKDTFKKPENANILFSFITGNKNGISPYTKKAFKKVNLSFLLSPSGIHFTAIFVFVTFFIKKIKMKWLKHLTKTSLLSSLFLMLNFEGLKRLIIMRILFQLKFITKIKLSLEQVFILTFLISYFIGQYSLSPLGFIFSFAFLGTFFALRSFSKLMLILGLFSTQLTIALFMGDKVSLLSIPIGLFGSFLFTLLFPLAILFLLTFWFIEINWLEPILQLYITGIKMSAKLLTGSFTSSSIFLILAVWILMFHKNPQRKYIYLGSLIFLHTNTAMTPVIFT